MEFVVGKATTELFNPNPAILKIAKENMHMLSLGDKGLSTSSSCAGMPAHLQIHSI